MPVHDEILLYTDGASRGNRGLAGIGFLIEDTSGRTLAEHAECIGVATNNEAEYTALIRGLTECTGYTRGRVHWVSDSLLVVRQMRGEDRVRAATLRPLYDRARRLTGHFAEVTCTHRPRSEPHIARVDRLVNQALDASAARQNQGT